MSFTHRVNHRDQCLSVSFQQVPFSLSLCASVSIASDLPDLITENACKNRTNNNTVGTDKRFASMLIHVFWCFHFLHFCRVHRTM